MRVHTSGNGALPTLLKNFFQSLFHLQNYSESRVREEIKGKTHKFGSTLKTCKAPGVVEQAFEAIVIDVIFQLCQ